MVEFSFEQMFPVAEDPTVYRILSRENIGTASFEGTPLLTVAPEALTLVSEQAFADVSHLLRPAHLKRLAEIFQDPESSANDRYVALELIKNAVISAEGVFPMCQDTGTAIIIGKRIGRASCRERV